MGSPVRQRPHELSCCVHRGLLRCIRFGVGFGDRIPLFCGSRARLVSLDVRAVDADILQICIRAEIMKDAFWKPCFQPLNKALIDGLPRSVSLRQISPHSKTVATHSIPFNTCRESLRGLPLSPACRSGKYSCMRSHSTSVIS